MLIVKLAGLRETRAMLASLHVAAFEMASWLCDGS